jgi:hypothetical protein
MADKLVVVFARERETKNTVRFAEQENAEGLPPVIGTLYVQKFVVKRLGDPQVIKITVERG